MSSLLSEISPVYMHRAIDLALRSEGRAVAPNPRVGALLVCRGRVIGEGYHERVGEGHAEVECFKSIRDEDRPLIGESILYVTLEPCAHEGRTPSCAKMLAREKVGAVVIGTLDPNPLVAGKGIEILRSAGIPVATGLLEEECRRVAKVFLANQERRRPFVLLKWAQSSDGYLDGLRTPGEPAARLSSGFTALLVHRLRSSFAGILAGRRTYELDRPRLDNRLWRVSPFSPRRIMLTRGKVPEGILPLREVTEEALGELLGKEGITSLMVEGGAETLQSFIRAGLWDEIRVETAPILLGGGVSAPALPPSARTISRQTVSGHLITTLEPYGSEAPVSQVQDLEKLSFG